MPSWLQEATREGAPPDGVHVAQLEVASEFSSEKGEFFKLEWSAESYLWASIYRLDTDFVRQKARAALEGLGIDTRATASDERAWLAALADAEGKLYEVRVERRGEFVDTFPLGPAPGRQEVLTPAAPERAPVADDEIPF